MGGRGATSSSGGGAVSPTNLARELFDKRAENAKELKQLKDAFKFDRDEYLKNGEVRDGDLSYWLIDKDGTEHVLGQFDSQEAYKAVDLRKVSYVMLQSGDGVNDSLGFNSDMLGADDDSSKLNAYTDEINRLYGTAWGKTH